MKFYLATSSKEKLKGAQELVSSIGYEVEMVKIDFVEGRAEDPKDIAIEKAHQAWEKLKKPIVVEDSGFFIEALNGFPMTHIKFSLQTLGIERILKMMVGEANRKAEWRSSAAYIDKDGIETFTSIFPGTISEDIRDSVRPTQTDYWKIWIPEKHNPEKLTWSEMDGDYLKPLKDYYREHNQFAMLASWLKENRS